MTKVKIFTSRVASQVEADVNAFTESKEIKVHDVDFATWEGGIVAAVTYSPAEAEKHEEKAEHTKKK